MLGYPFDAREIEEASVLDLSSEDYRAYHYSGQCERRYRRLNVDLETVMIAPEGDIKCAVYDLSPNGARVEILDGREVHAGMELMFELPDFGPIPAKVRHVHDGRVGLKLLRDDGDQMVLARHLVTYERADSAYACAHVGKAANGNTLVAGAVESACGIEEITKFGARLQIDDTRHLTQGQIVSLDLVDARPVPATVQHVEARLVDLAFLDELSLGSETAARAEIAPRTPERLTDRRTTRLSDDDQDHAHTIGSAPSSALKSPTNESDVAGLRPTDDLVGGLEMENLNDLEARAQAAAQALAGHQDRGREVEQMSGHLQSEIRELRGQNERLASEVRTLGDENQHLEAESAQLREEAKRLSGEDAQAREEVKRLKGDIEAIRQERDRLSAVLEALITQIELNPAPAASMSGIETATATAEVVKLAPGTVGIASDAPIENDDIGMEADSVVSAPHEEFYPGDEAPSVAIARRLVERIRSVSGRVEADKSESAKNLNGRNRNRS